MRLLLDTCVFLWMIGDDEALSAGAREAIMEPRNSLYLSAASSWELAIKIRIGKLELPGPAHRVIPAQMARNGVLGLAVEHVHALATERLDLHHRDPFDRLLIAQATIEQLTIVTPDVAFDSYAVSTLW